MTSIKKNALAVCALVLLGCAAMTVVDGVLRPPYAVKSAVKLTLFLLAPLLYEYTAGRDGHRALFRIQRRALLRALGVPAEETADSLTVRGMPSFSGGTVDGANDHRIVMAAAAAATAAAAPVTVTGAEAVRKSYPSFWEEYKRLGGSFDVL